MGLVYFLAFASLGFQITGLIGDQGILPAKEFLGWAEHQFKADKYTAIPTIFWFKSENLFLQMVCGAGALLGLLILAGKFHILITSACWFFYLSLASVGQEFLWYQWDTLLLEIGFLSIFLCPWTLQKKTDEAPSTFIVWLFRILAFKLEFSSGVVKLASGDPSWRNLSALSYHYETQPIPTFGGWFFHQLPHGFHEISTAFILVSQLICPFFIFAKRKWRIGYFFLMISTQGLIALSGNYGFFNILTVVLAILLLDDVFIKRIFLFFKVHLRQPFCCSMSATKHILLNIIGFVLLTLNFINIYGLVFKFELPHPLTSVIKNLQPFHLNNRYGLFAVMTKTRPEIVLEGSNDLKNWSEYKFKWKAGELDRPPLYVAPHQPRLDWQMWFAALGNFNGNPWFISFIGKIFTGSEDVLKLLKNNPFPNSPPLYLRAVSYDYNFTNWEGKSQTGRWWKQSSKRPYSPIIQNPFKKMKKDRHPSDVASN